MGYYICYYRVFLVRQNDSLLYTLSVLELHVQDKVFKVTLLSRRALPSLEGVDLSAEEREGRLVQHVEGDRIELDHISTVCM